jgi:methionyl-tRNA formyltransferase
MLRGEREVGLSMYTLTSGMDDGDVWAQTSTPVGPDEYIGDVLTRLEDACDEMIRRVYPRIVNDEVTPVHRTRAKRPTARFATVTTDGFSGATPAERIQRWIRAQSRPYPGAFTSCDGRRLTIWKAHLFPSLYYGRPGEVVRGPAGETMVICGDDRALVIDEMQMDDGDIVVTMEAIRPRVVLGVHPS